MRGVDEVGELVHAGPTVALGYWNRPEATAAVFSADPRRRPGESSAPGGSSFRAISCAATRDGFFTFVGRRDQQIKSHGFRISPEEIEEAIRTASHLVAEGRSRCRRARRGGRTCSSRRTSCRAIPSEASSASAPSRTATPSCRATWSRSASRSTRRSPARRRARSTAPAWARDGPGAPAHALARRAGARRRAARAGAPARRPRLRRSRLRQQLRRAATRGARGAAERRGRRAEPRAAIHAVRRRHGARAGSSAEALRASHAAPFDHRGRRSSLPARWRRSTSSSSPCAATTRRSEVVVVTPCWLDVPLYLRELRPRAAPRAARPAHAAPRPRRDRGGAVVAHAGRRLIAAGEPHGPPLRRRGAARARGSCSSRSPARPLLVSDECHRDLVFAPHAFVSPASFYDATCVVYSFGKRLFLQGQRLGYAAVSPRHPARRALARTLEQPHARHGLLHPDRPDAARARRSAARALRGPRRWSSRAGARARARRARRGGVRRRAVAGDLLRLSAGAGRRRTRLRRAPRREKESSCFQAAVFHDGGHGSGSPARRAIEMLERALAVLSRGEGPRHQHRRHQHERPRLACVSNLVLRDGAVVDPGALTGAEPRDAFGRLRGHFALHLRDGDGGHACSPPRPARRQQAVLRARPVGGRGREREPPQGRPRARGAPARACLVGAVVGHLARIWPRERRLVLGEALDGSSSQTTRPRNREGLAGARRAHPRRARSRPFRALRPVLAGRSVYVTLSGGLDSTTIAALAKLHLADVAGSLTGATFFVRGASTEPEPGTDAYFARRVAEALDPAARGRRGAARTASSSSSTRSSSPARNFRDFNVHCGLVNAALPAAASDRGAAGRDRRASVVLTGDTMNELHGRLHACPLRRCREYYGALPRLGAGRLRRFLVSGPRRGRSRGRRSMRNRGIDTIQPYALHPEIYTALPGGYLEAEGAKQGLGRLVMGDLVPSFIYDRPKVRGAGGRLGEGRRDARRALVDRGVDAAELERRFCRLMPASRPSSSSAGSARAFYLLHSRPTRRASRHARRTRAHRRGVRPRSLSRAAR